jgi:glutamate racemase
MNDKAKAKAIGIFDSGVGGLTVVREIMVKLPDKKLVYFGDSLRAPYGNRRPEELILFSREIIDFLTERNIGALVVACGTISATVFDVVQKMVDMPIVGMLEAAVDGALAATKTGRMGLVATAGTIASRAHQKAIGLKRPDITLKAVACPLFVPLVEEGWLDNDVARLVAQKYLAEFNNSEIDTLILGCTHYPLLMESIKAALSADINIVDPAVKLAENLVDIVDDAEEENPRHEFFVSGNKDKFDEMSRIVLGRSFDARVV